MNSDGQNLELQTSNKMKRLFTTATLLVALCVSAFAQDGKKKISFGIGLEGALPMGALKTVYPIGAGLTARLTYAIDEKMAITGTTGAIAFIPDKAAGANAKAQLNIPIKAGYKYMLTDNVYGILETGYTISKAFYLDGAGKLQSVSGSSFTYAPGVGAKLGFLDTSLRYESYGSGGNFLGLRLGFDF